MFQGSLSLITWAFLAATVLALILWYIIRIRFRMTRLPVLRILRDQSFRKPGFTILRPPLIPFLSFLLICLCLIILALRPGFVTLQSLPGQEASSHLFLDMSPSVAAQISLDDYIKRVSELWVHLKKSGNVSVSSTHSQEIWVPKNAPDLAGKLADLGFHRWGIRLGGALRKQWPQLSHPDQLIVVSDQDAHSWQNFHWQFLKGESSISYVPMLADDALLSNLYIKDARYLSARAASLMEWEITLSRSMAGRSESGNLLLSQDGQLLNTVSWEFLPEQQDISLHVSWSPPQERDSGKGRQESFIWELQPSVMDQLPLDNIFRSRLTGSRQQAILIAKSAGEQRLESPTHSLQMALEVMGMQAERYDRTDQSLPDVSDVALWLLFAGSGDRIDSFCPSSLVRFRHQEQEPVSSPVQVWISPYHHEKRAFRNICWCYHRLLHGSSEASDMPSYCREIPDQRRYASVLQAAGARQMGGESGRPEQAIAWEGDDRSGRLRVLAFSLPMRAVAGSPLSHASFPLLLKDMLKVEGFAAPGKGNQNNWPRYPDLSLHRFWNTKETLLTEKGRQEIFLSNVPVGESVLKSAPDTLFPPYWDESLHVPEGTSALQQEHPDSLPLVLALAALAVLLTMAELIACFVRRKRGVSGQGFRILLLLMIPGALGAGSDAFARIRVNLKGFDPVIPLLPLQELAEQLSSRTSLKMDSEPIRIGAGQLPPLRMGWLWAAKPTDIASPGKAMGDAFAAWLRRGGFLIIENVSDLQNIKTLTSRGFDFLPNKGEWKAIPPDHELMRSFYLLDALPGCQKAVWHGYQYDGRLAILTIPFPFLQSSGTFQAQTVCGQPVSRENYIRIFINILMVALTTDYKKDQIHMREILKRL
ncbi:MAG: DUF4159 domain-containing protein [Deltaproteobacteria bacterium]|nr:DUF4159 domain-containing protein [Deltaproteobacteria bacterium]